MDMEWNRIFAFRININNWVDFILYARKRLLPSGRLKNNISHSPKLTAMLTSKQNTTLHTIQT